MRCAFCGSDTDDRSMGAYLEIELTNPENAGPQRQLFGAHSSCLTGAMLDGSEVDAEHLMGR